jgi:hypothetical protein
MVQNQRKNCFGVMEWPFWVILRNFGAVWGKNKKKF